ncbi:MAG: endonuclease Q family protein [Candidatus Magasanikbacteria bacterium]
MTEKIFDLHIHSKYSRACSKDLELPNIARACEKRGIDVVVTGDFTHPKWFHHINENLVEDKEGVYRLKDKNSKVQTNNKFQIPTTQFLIGTEVASIRKHKDKTRRVHLNIFAPNIEVAEKFNKKLDAMGFNLASDGRPILGRTCKEILEIMLEVDERMVMIPAHAWTPWFGILGSKGGYDSLEDAFEDLAPHISAIETGLSSDPLMNWQVSFLDNITLVSNSDAHSTAKLGREANVLQFVSEESVTYDEIMRIIRDGDRDKFLYTIEFYPEEGKYHFDGHRACGVSLHPTETKKYGGMCPSCKKPMVIGVMNRVDELGDRTEEEAKLLTDRVPYKSMVPLPEIISDVVQVGVKSKRVQGEYENLLEKIGSEFHILLHASLDEIEKASTKEIADAVDRVRKGNIRVVPGYDGEFGIVKVFSDAEKSVGSKQGVMDLD